MYCANPDCQDFKLTGVHGEYVEGVTECPYCGSTPVEHLPDITIEEDLAEPEAAEDEIGSIDELDEGLVVIATYSSREDAEFAISYLEDRGIEVYESSDDHGAANPSDGFGKGIRLLTLESQVESAMALLKQVERDL